MICCASSARGGLSSPSESFPDTSETRPWKLAPTARACTWVARGCRTIVPFTTCGRTSAVSSSAAAGSVSRRAVTLRVPRSEPADRSAAVCRPQLRRRRREPQKNQELRSAVETVSEPRAAALSAIPTAHLRQIAAMFRPARLVGNAQRVSILVAVARVVALGAGQQAKPPNPASTPVAGRKRI